MGNDATRCYVCGGEFSTKRTIIEGRAAHEGCAVMSYPPHTADAMAKMHDALQTEIERLTPYVEAFRREETRADNAGRKIDDLNAEIERLRANQERMWCKACGTVTRDRQCDCTKFSDQDTQSLVNYADAMQKSAHEEAQENERLRAALKPFAEAGLSKSCLYNDLHGALCCLTMIDLRCAATAYEQNGYKP